MFVKASNDFDSPWGMMHLMAKAPKEQRFVPEAMPPVVNKSRDEVSDGGRCEIVKIIADMQQRRVRHPAVPSISSQKNDPKLD